VVSPSNISVVSVQTIASVVAEVQPNVSVTTGAAVVVGEASPEVTTLVSSSSASTNATNTTLSNTEAILPEQTEPSTTIVAASNISEIIDNEVNITTTSTTTELTQVTNDTIDSQGVLINDENLQESTTSHSLMTGSLDLQTQLYIISGTFGAVVFLLILLVLTLALSVAKIKDQLCDSEARYIPGREQIHGYQNGAFNGGADVVRGVNERSVDGHSDLEKLGYTIYSGKGSSRENVYKVNDPLGGAGEQGENIPLDSVSHSGGRQMMKYEEGVIPMADDEHGNNYR